MTNVEVRKLFPEGKLVALRSGSPLMTVEWITNEDDAVTVVWFRDADVLRNTFHYAALVAV